MLILCQHCHKKYSNTVLQCPHCHTWRNANQRKWTNILVAAAIIISVFLGFFALLVEALLGAL
ncbi:MAG: hypothetical protein MR993_00575 [Spirochaetes bacterium]|nr:hypothetical protein [Spirochaetota bacterium]